MHVRGTVGHQLDSTACHKLLARILIALHDGPTCLSVCQLTDKHKSNLHMLCYSSL